MVTEQGPPYSTLSHLKRRQHLKRQARVLMRTLATLGESGHAAKKGGGILRRKWGPLLPARMLSRTTSYNLPYRPGSLIRETPPRTVKEAHVPPRWPAWPPGSRADLEQAATVGTCGTRPKLWFRLKHPQNASKGSASPQPSVGTRVAPARGREASRMPREHVATLPRSSVHSCGGSRCWGKETVEREREPFGEGTGVAVWEGVLDTAAVRCHMRGRWAREEGGVGALYRTQLCARQAEERLSHGPLFPEHLPAGPALGQEQLQNSACSLAGMGAWLGSHCPAPATHHDGERDGVADAFPTSVPVCKTGILMSASRGCSGTPDKPLLLLYSTAKTPHYHLLDSWWAYAYKDT